MLMDYFSIKGHEDEAKQFAIKEIRKDSTNKSAWALLGELKMMTKDWNEAVTAYQRAVNIDSAYIEAIFNLGVCYSAGAQEQMKDNKAFTKESVNTILLKAEECFEKTRRLDPESKVVDWPKPLYQIYLLLGRKKEAEQLLSKVTN